MNCRGSTPLSVVAADRAGHVDAGFTRQVTVFPPENREIQDHEGCRPPPD